MRRGLSDVDLVEFGLIGTRLELGVSDFSCKVDNVGKGAVLLYESLYSSRVVFDGAISSLFW